MKPAMPLALCAGSLIVATVLAACGGDIHKGALPAPTTTTAPPDAPASSRPEVPQAFTLSPTADKRLHFSWQAARGASEYRLLEDVDGASGYRPLATLPADSTQYDSAPLLPTRLNARYLLQACNPLGCSDAQPSTLPDGLARSVDYFKASNSGARDLFGSRIALSARGDTLAVGAPDEDGSAVGANGEQADEGARNSGAVYVFTRAEGGGWRQQAYLKASNTGADDAFGSAVSLSADGRTLLVGAPLESSAATGGVGNEADNSLRLSGAAYVFEREASGDWRQRAYLKASNAGELDKFGSQLAISGDANTLAIGAPGEASAATGIDGDQADDSQVQSGAVYVFAREAGGWRQQHYLKASNSALSDSFGDSLALSATGDTLAVGASGEDSAASGVDGDQANNARFASGALYMFVRSGQTWRQQAYLKTTYPSDLSGFGQRLALSADGHTLAAGASRENSAATGVDGPQNDTTAPQSGAVLVFSREQGRWQQQAYLKASNTNAGDWFGASVSLSGDGRLLAVGAVHECSTARGLDGDQLDNAGSANGAVYLFERREQGWRQRSYLKAPNPDPGDRYGFDVALSADGHTLAVTAANEDSAARGLQGDGSDNSAVNSGAVYLY